MINAIRKKPLFFAAIATSILILVFSYFPEKLPVQHIVRHIGQNQTPIFLGGVIDSEVRERDTSYGDHLVNFELKAKEMSEEKNGAPSRTTGRARVYLRNINKELNYGDEVLIKGDLRDPKGVRNPGGFNQKAYLERQGIRALFYGDSQTEVRILNRHQGNFLKEKALEVKDSLSRSFSSAFDKRDAGFLKALFLGERGDLDDDFKDLFIKTGTMHILAVSGFNIGFLTMTLFLFLRFFRISKNIKLWLTLGLVWVYCLLVGWQSPVARASVMATVLIAGQLLGRKPNILNSLGLAALLILIINPKQLFDVGFQLSFIAVFAIARLLPIFFEHPEAWPNEKWTVREKAWRYLRELFWVSFVCLVATLPITVENFYIVTPLSLLANLVVVPLSFLIFFFGVIFFMTFWWVPKWLSVIPLAIQLMMKVFVGSLFLIENLPGAVWIVGKPHPVFLGVLIAGIFFILRDKKIKNALARAAILILFISSMFSGQALARHFHRDFRMTVLDVGQGDAIYFEFPYGGDLLMDAGKGGEGDRGRWVIGPFLRSKGISSISALALSHPQEDHVGGMAAVLDEFDVKSVFDAGTSYPTKTFSRLQEKIKEKKALYFHIKRGEEIKGFREIRIRVLNPGAHDAQDKNVNNESLVLKISYGTMNFLLTGDIEEKAMQDMVSSGQEVNAEVLKVPHHGSRVADTGKQFIQLVNPKISVISVGEHNMFHHPSPETLKALASIPSNRVFRTDKDHAVEIISDGKNLW